MMGRLSRTTRSSGRSGWGVVIAVALLLGYGALFGRDDPSLSEAYCNDLKDGHSPNQILGSTYEPDVAADRAYGFASISCPEELRTNEMLRTYLDGVGHQPRRLAHDPAHDVGRLTVSLG